MQYINPYEILNVQAENLSDIDFHFLRKLKRQLIIDIELDNDRFFYHGCELSKSACISVLDELDDEHKRRFYFFIYQNKNLNNFLAEGDLELFEKYRLEEIYNLPTFVDFISSYFCERFSTALLEAFRKAKPQLILSILKYKDLINDAEINIAFRDLDKELANRIAEIDFVKNKIEEGVAIYKENHFSKSTALVKNLFPPDTINALPRYFQSSINRAAESINFLMLVMISDYEAQLDVISHLLKLNVDSVQRKIFEKNYEVAKKNYDTKIIEEKNEPTFKKYRDIISQIREYIKQVDDKTKKPLIKSKDVYILFNIQELNALPDFCSEIRNELAYSLRSLSISFWNEQNDLNAAIDIINLAAQIKVSKEVKDKFDSDLKDFERLKAEKQKMGEPIDSAPSLRTFNGIGTTIYGDTLYFVVLFFPIIPINRYNLTPTIGGYRFHGRLKLHAWQLIWQWVIILGIIAGLVVAAVNSNSSSYSSASNSNSSYSQSEKPTTSPDYSSTSNDSTKMSSNNKLSDSSVTGSVNSPTIDTANSKSFQKTSEIILMHNGNIGDCSDFEPRYDYSINTRLIITAESTDAAVKLFDYVTDKCIRFVYIKDGTTYSMKNIPEGKYYLKIAYGSDWSVEESDPKCKGHFSSHAIYKRDDHDYDFNKYEQDGHTYLPYYTLKLYTTFSDNNLSNISPGSISESDFSNN